jgi:hypothetical protein
MTAKRIDRVLALPVVVNQLAGSLLQKAQREAQGEPRLLLQRLRAAVPDHEVRNACSGGKPRLLRIYGSVESVNAPGAPLAWPRLCGMLAVGAATVAIIAICSSHSSCINDWRQGFGPTVVLPPRRQRHDTSPALDRSVADTNSIVTAESGALRSLTTGLVPNRLLTRPPTPVKGNPRSIR